MLRASPPVPSPRKGVTDRFATLKMRTCIKYQNPSLKTSITTQERFEIHKYRIFASVKRLSILAMLMFYTVASFGISVNYFYCCGKLKSVSLSAELAPQCNMPSSKKCCKNKKIVLKINNDQKIIDQALLKAPVSFAVVPAPVFAVPFAANYNSVTAEHFSDSSPPPLLNRQVLFCSFRI